MYISKEIFFPTIIIPNNIIDIKVIYGVRPLFSLVIFSYTIAQFLIFLMVFAEIFYDKHGYRGAHRFIQIRFSSIRFFF